MSASARGQLNHAYGFVGPSQMGKRLLAKTAAAELLKTTPERLATNPDFYLVEREWDEKNDRLKKDIAISQARSLKEALSARPWFGGYQVVIINEAEFLNEESANSLLKVLEEPGAKTVFFLLCEDERKILPTIYSRCEWWKFLPANTGELSQGLAAVGFEDKWAQEAAEWGWGRPGRALELARDPAKMEFIKSEAKRWQKIRRAPIYERWLLAGDVAGDKKGVDKKAVAETLLIWQMCEREQLLGGSEESQNLSVKIIDGLDDLNNWLNRNINFKLGLEQFLTIF